MKTRTIEITIPRWIPTRHQWVKWKKKVKLFLIPPRCSSCECKLPVEYPIYYKVRTGHHLGYDNTQAEFAINTFGKQLCASCLKQYIHELKLKPGTCELCQTRNIPVIGYHYTKNVMTITFLWHWWNGRDFCLPCVDDVLDTGTVKNSY